MSKADPDAQVHLLVVDDELSLLRSAQRALEGAGYRVTAVSSASAALAQARAQSFALIVLDVMLPWMDGFSVYQTLRAEGAAVATPVLFLSAKPADGAAVTIVDPGNRIYAIAKPYKATALVRVVGEILSKEPA